MILIDALPCRECQHYKGIVQPDGTEKSEKIKCDIAKQKNAANMLEGLRCDGYKKDENKRQPRQTI